LGSPKVGSKDLIADSGRRHAAVEQRRSDEPHERERTTGENLNVVRKRNVAQIDVALARPGVAVIEGLVPGLGAEVVDLAAEMEHRVSQRMICCSAVGVRENDGPLGLGTRDLLDDREHRRNAGACAGQQQR
jgi:hypothetical protein